MGFNVKPAQKLKRYLKACFYGESNGGKTLTALKLMRELVGEEGRIAVIDTEDKRSALYQGVVDFELLDLSEDENGDKVKHPYTQARYIGALQFLVEQGFQGIIIDSLTPVWKKPGGILDQHKEISKKEGKWSGNSFSAWQETDVLYWDLIDAIQATKCHVICTLRANEEWVEQYNEQKKKNQWVKEGVKPEFRGNITYEFDLFAKFEKRGMMTIETWRILEDLPDYAIERPGRDFAQKILAWLEGATPPPPLIEQSLASFQKAFPGFCAKNVNWKESLIRLALALPDLADLPATYTEEQRSRVKAYVEQKKQEAQAKAEQRRILAEEAHYEPPATETVPAPVPSGEQRPLASEQQVASLRKLYQHLSREEPEGLEGLSYDEAKQMIADLSQEYRQSRSKVASSAGGGK